MGYTQEQLRCARIEERLPNECDSSWDAWTCDVFTQKKIPMTEVAGRTLRDAPTYVENTDWKILNLVEGNLEPTVVGGVEECALCLGYSPGQHPDARAFIEPETSMDGL